MGGALIRLAASRRYADDSFAKKTEVRNRQMPVDPPRDARYRALEVEKEFSGGYCATSVALLRGGQVVRKCYDMKAEPGRLFFWHELGMLQKLRGCPYVPKLMHFDRDEGTIYMSFCGKSGVKNSAEVQRQLRFQLKEMRDKWGVSRADGLHPRLLGETAYGFELNNVTRKDDRLFFIDFGGYKWSYRRPRATPKPASLDPAKLDVVKLDPSKRAPAAAGPSKQAAFEAYRAGASTAKASTAKASLVGRGANKRPSGSAKSDPPPRRDEPTRNPPRTAGAPQESLETRELALQVALSMAAPSAAAPPKVHVDVSVPADPRVDVEPRAASKEATGSAVAPCASGTPAAEAASSEAKACEAAAEKGGPGDAPATLLAAVSGAESHAAKEGSVPRLPTTLVSEMTAGGPADVGVAVVQSNADSPGAESHGARRGAARASIATIDAPPAAPQWEALPPPDSLPAPLVLVPPPDSLPAPLMLVPPPADVMLFLRPLIESECARAVLPLPPPGVAELMVPAPEAPPREDARAGTRQMGPHSPAGASPTLPAPDAQEATPAHAAEERGTSTAATQASRAPPPRNVEGVLSAQGDSRLTPRSPLPCGERGANERRCDVPPPPASAPGPQSAPARVRSAATAPPPRDRPRSAARQHASVVRPSASVVRLNRKGDASEGAVNASGMPRRSAKGRVVRHA
jgi:hypothetical protein